MDYEQILNKLRNKRDYFNSIGFPILAEEYGLAINAIEDLLKQIKNKEGSG